MNVGVLLLIVVTLLVLTPLFAPLPKSALAGVILVVAYGLLEPVGFRELARVDRRELGLALLTVVIVVAVGMVAGVLVTIVLSLFLVALRAAQPRRTLLVRVPGTDSFRSVDSVAGGFTEPGLVVYRFDAPLFFANSQVLADDILGAVADANAVPVRWIVIDAEVIGEVDSTGAAMLGDLFDDLHGRGVTLALARLKAPVAAYLSRAGVMDRIGRERVYLEVDDAVAAFHATAAAAPTGRTTGAPMPGDPTVRR
jgi:SulP family sulfate permease